MKESFHRFITKKIPEIAEGWKNILIPDIAAEKLAYSRLNTCVPCEENSTKGKIVMRSVCKACGCVLEAKARSPKSQCPKNKWQDSEQTSTP